MISYQWYWDNAGTWSPFGDKDNTNIEGAFVKGLANVQLAINGQSYTITFATMSQANNKTKVTRKVKRELLKDPSSSTSHASTNSAASGPSGSASKASTSMRIATHQIINSHFR
jgi:hypothetical protein